MANAATSLPPSAAPSAKSVSRYGYWLALALMIILYVIIFTGLAFNQHAALRTHKSDLGQMDQAIWNTSRGRFVEEIKQDFLSTRLTDHVEPIFIPVSLAFWLWDDVRAILLLQVMALALGAIPLFALTRSKLGGALALGFVAAYFLNPSLQSAALTEFHAIPLAVPFILWAFWAADKRRWRQAAAAALLLAAVKEEAALLAAGLGAWIIWRDFITDRRLKQGALLGASVTILALLWFFIATFVIVPAYGAQVHHTAHSIYFERYGELGDSPLDIVKTIALHPRLAWSLATEPARVRYLLGLFASFGFLSLLGLDVLLLALPLLLANLFSAYPAQYYGDFHYTAPLIPYFAAAAIYGLHRLLTFFRSAGLARGLLAPLALIWLLGWSGYVYAQAGRGPLGGAYDRAEITPHQQLIHRFLTQIPPDAPVTATAALHPHLAHRRFIYQFPYGADAQPPARPAQWAFIDVSGDTDMAPGDLRDAVMAMLADDWGVVDGADGYLLLRRGAPNRVIPDAFYDFARTPDDAAALSQTYPLTFARIDAQAWPRWRQARVITEWLVGASYQPGAVRPWLELLTPSGKLLYTYDQLSPPALIWYPPERWRPGDRIRIATLPLYPPRYWGAGVGVVHGPDPFQPNHRLPASNAAPGVEIRAENGTLALAAAWQWRQDNALSAIPPQTLLAPDLGPRIQPRGREMTVDFRTEEGTLIPLRAWLPDAAPAAGRLFDFWMRWEQGVPQGYQPFVHLRRSGRNIVQEDGPPLVFLPLDAQQPINDWREFIVPMDAAQPGDEVNLFVGLYNPETGQRLDILGSDGKLTGNEALLGTWRLAPPPVPDQPCALLDDTCLSQP